jgi:hypothetical protein
LELITVADSHGDLKVHDAALVNIGKRTHGTG